MTSSPGLLRLCVMNFFIQVWSKDLRPSLYPGPLHDYLDSQVDTEVNMPHPTQPHPPKRTLLLNTEGTWHQKHGTPYEPRSQLNVGETLSSYDAQQTHARSQILAKTWALLLPFDKNSVHDAWNNSCTDGGLVLEKYKVYSHGSHRIIGNKLFPYCQDPPSESHWFKILFCVCSARCGLDFVGCVGFVGGGKWGNLWSSKLDNL